MSLNTIINSLVEQDFSFSYQLSDKVNRGIEISLHDLTVTVTDNMSIDDFHKLLDVERLKKAKRHLEFVKMEMASIEKTILSLEEKISSYGS